MKENKITSIDEYISIFSKDIQVKLQELRKLINDCNPNITETMSWQMPTFKLNGNLVHFAAHKNHIGLYPGSTAIVEFSEELKDYKTSKGAIQFPLDKTLPLSLIKKIVEYNIKYINK